MILARYSKLSGPTTSIRSSRHSNESIEFGVADCDKLSREERRMIGAFLGYLPSAFAREVSRALGVLTVSAVCMAGAATQLASAQSLAQGYPDRPIRIVVPFTPGSPNDVVARVISQPLSARLGQPVLIENRPGGGTLIGIRAVLSAERDGYTLLKSSCSATIWMRTPRQSGWPFWRSRRGDDCRGATITQAIFS